MKYFTCSDVPKLSEAPVDMDDEEDDDDFEGDEYYSRSPIDLKKPRRDEPVIIDPYHKQSYAGFLLPFFMTVFSVVPMLIYFIRKL